MKKNSFTSNLIMVLLAVSVLFSSCASTTMIQSTPSGAKVFVNTEYAGTTPYTYEDSRITGSEVSLRLELPGHEPLNTMFARDERVDGLAVIGGCLFLVPFLWAMKYKPTHMYELKPLSNWQPEPETQQKPAQTTKSKADRLREIKQLYDEKILTQQEYEDAKKKILEE
ncbi:MAG TPA: PEGA domain-containing protein [Bacteroidia bacterium]|nr:PEGA domain-containing protein [Bacteroidia bacterium]